MAWKRSAVIQAEADLESVKIQSEAQKQAAQLYYDAAIKQIEEQKLANAEQQQFNKDEAELAFERNSSKGQLKQLMEAGLSEVQARQIIAGGSAGSYTAAPSVNQNQGVDYTAPASAQGQQLLSDSNVQSQAVQSTAAGEINHTKTQILDFFNDLPARTLDLGFRISESLISDSLSSSTGGYLGNLATGSLQGQVLRHIDEIPIESRGSYAAFCSYANSAAAPGWCKTADFQKALQSASSSPMTRRAAQNFFDTSNQLLTGDTYFKNILLDSDMKSSAAKIASFKVDQDKLATDLQQIEQDYKISILPDRYSAMLNTYQAEIAEMATKRDLWNNEDYKKAWLANKLLNEEDAAIITKVMKMKHNAEFKYLSDNPERSQLFAIYQLFSDAGMTDNLFGEVVASIEAYGNSALGFGVTDILKDVNQWIHDDSDFSRKREKRLKEQKRTLYDAMLQGSQDSEYFKNIDKKYQ